MEVEIATARHRFEHGGHTHYFCCAGCHASFVADLERV
jgi:Cu+-exporting ATPase